MGCIFSKGTSEPDQIRDESKKVDNSLKDENSVQLVAPTPSLRDFGGASMRRILSRNASRANGSTSNVSNHQRWATVEMAGKEKVAAMSRITSLPLGAESEHQNWGWPSWLTSVAADAIQGWVPRRTDSFEKLDKIGQGTYGSVYEARDLETGKIVALKKIKCLMKQLLSGLEHCHSRGVLHRDIKGSNLLINNDGVLKIADFGLATLYEPNQKEPLTSRVVTLWYRAPELLLGSTHYGAAIDMWSTGCILAELFARKPIMTGRTEVEQMHKIFKLCGSPSEDFWKNSKLPDATSYKPQQPYKRRLSDTFKDFPSTAFAFVDKLLSVEAENRGSAGSAFKSKFFTTQPVACNPSALPKYPPNKEFDTKLQNEAAKRQRVCPVKRRGAESVRRGSRETKVASTPDYSGNIISEGKNPKSTGHKSMPQHQDSITGFAMEANRRARQKYSQCSSLIHPKSAVGSSMNSTTTSARNKPELRTQASQKPHTATDLNKNETVYQRKWNRICE